MTSAAREAWELISAIFWSDETHRRYHDVCEHLEVTPPMLKALLFLEADEARPMRALAEQLRCDASWVTSLVDGLEERGFVERQVSPQDRRVKTVSLTQEGIGAKKAALDRLHEPPPSFNRLAPAEARRLRDLLRKVSAG